MARDLTSSKPQSSGWHIALDAANPADDDAVYLGDPEAVHAMLGMFNAAVVERQQKVAAGTMTAHDAVEADRHLAVRISDILLGRVPGYVPIGEWNSEAESGIVDHAARIFNIETVGYDRREVLATAWGLHLRALYETAGAAMRGEPDETWQAALAQADDLMMAACLGTHWPGAYEGEPHP